MTAEGALVIGATMANFTCLAAARNRVLKQAGWNVDADGLFGAPPVRSWWARKRMRRCSRFSPCWGWAGIAP